MKSTVLKLSIHLFFSSILFSQNITEAEYFFDADPGIGLANSLAVNSNTGDLNQTFNISTVSQTDGLHFFGIRVKDDTSKWSLYDRQWIYVSKTSMLANLNITAAEYFFDNDPGIGLANNLAVNTNTGSLNQSFSISVASESNGLHFFAIRVKDDVGKWSLYDNQWVYISKSNDLSNLHIVAAEYFFDTDLGIGNNTALSIPNETNPLVSTSIPLPSLSAGVHIFYVRVKDAQNTWSLYDRQLIYVANTDGNASIVAFEYFIDTETNGVTTLPVNPPEQAPNVTFNFGTTGLAEGDHVFYIRSLNEDNQWSLYATEIFTIDISLTVEESLFKTITLFPNPFENSIHIESSVDINIENVIIYDLNGKSVYTGKNVSNTINLEFLSQGVYILSLEADNKKATFKIVKE